MELVTVWRSVACGVDGLVFCGVLIGGGKFHNGGVERWGPVGLVQGIREVVFEAARVFPEA